MTELFQVRQHVNPLSRFFQLPLVLPSPDELFENSKLPIHLDIGCARGRFLLNMATLETERNYLGVEIRKPLVIAAEKERKELGLTNLKFLFCNANVSLDNWLSNLSIDLLESASIQFPDPWFKRRHQKRRILQPSLLISLAQALNPNCKFFIQSDLIDVIEPMIYLIEKSSCFNRCAGLNGFWLDQSPFAIPTERETYALINNLPVHRALYVRNDNPVPKIESLVR